MSALEARSIDAADASLQLPASICVLTDTPIGNTTLLNPGFSRYHRNSARKVRRINRKRFEQLTISDRQSRLFFLQQLLFAFGKKGVDCQPTRGGSAGGAGAGSKLNGFGSHVRGNPAFT